MGLFTGPAIDKGKKAFVLEVLASDFSTQKHSERATIVPASPPAADPKALEEAAKLLGNAHSPLLITANGGRNAETALAIEQLAQAMAVPVIHYRPRYLALPTEHPMNCGFDPHGMIPDADLILVIDSDVPWIPDTAKLKADCMVVHLGTDPLFAR